MTTQTQAAWDRAHLEDPHAQGDKADRVQAMFGAIAPRYDLNNRVHSLWRDQAWRRAAVRMAEVRDGDRVLDMACGTGDLTHLFARANASEVIGADFTPAMLELAGIKRARLPESIASKVSYQTADAMDLPFEDASFDILSIAFGIRNVQQPTKALREFARVLKPEGRLIVLEFTVPRLAPVRWFNRLYSGWIMPRTATWISGDKSGAYKYLPKSVATFQDREQMVREIQATGFSDVRTKSLSLGICACYRGLRA